jgi:hypothetical protein
MGTEHDYESRNDVEHRRCDFLDKSLSVDYEKRLRIAHPARLARRKQNPIKPI